MGILRVVLPPYVDRRDLNAHPGDVVRYLDKERKIKIGVIESVATNTVVLAENRVRHALPIGIAKIVEVLPPGRLAFAPAT
jgi:hypothetical protein